MVGRRNGEVLLRRRDFTRVYLYVHHKLVTIIDNKTISASLTHSQYSDKSLIDVQFATA